MGVVYIYIIMQVHVGIVIRPIAHNNILAYVIPYAWCAINIHTVSYKGHRTIWEFRTIVTNNNKEP